MLEEFMPSCFEHFGQLRKHSNNILYQHLHYILLCIDIFYRERVEMESVRERWGGHTRNTDTNTQCVVTCCCSWTSSWSNISIFCRARNHNSAENTGEERARQTKCSRAHTYTSREKAREREREREREMEMRVWLATFCSWGCASAWTRPPKAC